MLKLRTILDFRENINNQIILLKQLSEDYIQLIDDDLFNVDMTAVPQFTDEILTGDLMVAFTTKRQLKQKYMVRFCDDFGLVLVSETETNNGYEYLFKCEEKK